MGPKDDGSTGCVIIGGGVIAGDDDMPGAKDPSGTEKDECDFWCRNKGLFIGLGVAAVAGGLLWWLLSDSKAKGKKKDFIPPAPVPGDTPIDEPPVIPPVDPPPCLAPNTLVNNVCTPPVVVPPPVDPSEGGTTPTTPGMGGGVR